MHPRPVGAGEGDHLGQRLDDAGFVVGQHDRDQGRRGGLAEQLREAAEIDQTRVRQGDRGGIGRCGQHGIVLAGRDQYCRVRAGQGEIVGLGAGTGEHDRGRGRADQGRDLVAGPFHPPPRRPAEAVYRGRIAGLR